MYLELHNSHLLCLPFSRISGEHLAVPDGRLPNELCDYQFIDQITDRSYQCPEQSMMCRH